MGLPLVLRACLEKSFGTIHTYKDGRICEAHFIYLDGNVNTGLMADFKNRWEDRMFICLTTVWQEALKATYPEMFCTRRYVMTFQLQNDKIDKFLEITHLIPNEYHLRPFDEDAYILKPFGFGSNYKSYQDFRLNGSGYVVWYNNKIVSSASSFLTLGNDVELNLYTLPEHRRKGLGIACSAAMLSDCVEKHINMHWDAQNSASRNMAEKLGYELQYEYNAYSFFESKEP